MAVNLDFIADEWIPALRSGKYAQGKRQLRVEDLFCCLGVACDLVKERVGVEWISGRFAESESLLPKAVRLFVGIDSGGHKDREGTRLIGDGNADLAGLNDNGASFLEIADVLAEYLARKRAVADAAAAVA